MRRVLLADGCTVWVSWLSARLDVEVNHTCLAGHGAWSAGEFVSSIVKVLGQEEEAVA